MGSLCSAQIVPVISIDKGDDKSDSWKGKQNARKNETIAQEGQIKKKWTRPSSTPMPKGIILTPEPDQLAVENNGAHLNVGPRTSGLDVVSHSGSSVRSSTDCSISSAGTSIQIGDRDGPAPPRLLTLNPDLHKLLMGRLDDLSRIPQHPKVIHLQLIAPANDYSLERQVLWQHTYTPLRKLCAEQGYTLNIQDDFWSPHNAYLPPLDFPQSFKSQDYNWCFDEVDVVMIMLMDAVSYILPQRLSTDEYDLLSRSLSRDSDLISFFKVIYQTRKESEESTCYLFQRKELNDLNKEKLPKLVTSMVHCFQANGRSTTCFHSPYNIKLKEIVSNPSLLSQNTVVVFPQSEKSDAGSTKENRDKDELLNIRTAIEKGCKGHRIVKMEPPNKNSYVGEMFNKDASLKGMGQTVQGLLWNIIESVITKREAQDRNIVTGVSPSLVDELLSQARFSQRLRQVEPLFHSATEKSMQEFIAGITEMPIIVHAPPGWGLSTLGARLAEYCKKMIPKALVIYRSLGVSPDTMTLQSTLLSIHQQINTILGCKGQGDNVKLIFPTKSLLGDIVRSSTFNLPIVIFLEGVTLPTSKLKELEVMTLAESLPATTKLIVMTSEAVVTRGLRLKMKDAFHVKVVPWEKQSIADLFSKITSDQKVFMSDTQTAQIANAIKQCPLPLFAVTTAQVVSFSYYSGQMASLLNDIPSSVEGVIQKLFDILESHFPPKCFQIMMAYLCASMGGITPWEMNDLLSLNNHVIQSIYANETEPLIFRVPTSLWKSLFGILKPFLRVYTSINFYSTCLASCTISYQAIDRFINLPGIFETLHKEMNEYFDGKWADSEKPYFPSEEQTKSFDRHVIPQATKYGTHYNVRKLLCLPRHTILCDCKRSFALEKYILNLSWIVDKLDGVSNLQVLVDFEMAKRTTYLHTHANDLDLMQAIYFTCSNSLVVCGREIYKVLHQSVILANYKSKTQVMKNSIYFNSSSYYKMIECIDKIPVPHLHPSETESKSLPQLSPVLSLLINDIIPIHEESNFVAVISKSEGEIKIYNWKNNEVVRTLKGLDHPSTLKMIDAMTAVVQCNRKLYIMDLNDGTVLNKLRIVLNLRMPYFSLQNKERIAVLSRDRMVVNIINIKTGEIISTFKAGETRFLDSLLLSKDGKMLVCGDETQKPYPLLAWSLDHGKLVHDIRLSQHEFLTSMADITDNGNYLACGCKEVSVTTSNFIVIYDLVSGQLLKKFKMAAIVTALAISSKTMLVVAALDTAQLVVWEIVSGNCRCIIDGVHASVDSIQLSLDGHRCLTSCSKEYSISAHTVSLWDINEGHLLGTHTFHAQVSSVCLTATGDIILAGVMGQANPVSLTLFTEKDNKHHKVKSKHPKEDEDSQEEFGDSSRKGDVIQVSYT